MFVLIVVDYVVDLVDWLNGFQRAFFLIANVREWVYQPLARFSLETECKLFSQWQSI